MKIKEVYLLYYITLYASYSLRVLLCNLYDDTMGGSIYITMRIKKAFAGISKYILTVIVHNKTINKLTS